MASRLYLLGGHGFALRFCPALFRSLASAPKRKRILGHIFSDAGGRPDVGAFADLYRGNQRAVAADEDVVANFGLVLADAVVIARNRAGSHVHALADLGIAQIGKMVCLRPLPQFDLLGLHKIAHVRAFSNLAARTQVRVRTDDRSGTDAGFVQNGAGTNQDPVADFRVLDHAVRPNAAVASNPGAAQQLHERFNDCVGPHLDIRIDDATLRIEDARAGVHEFAAFRQADESVDVHHLGARVAAQNLGWVGSL